MTEPYYPSINPLAAGLRCRCPRCGKGALFKGYLDIQPACPSCGLDFSEVDAGDGPAVFVIMILGFLVVGLALWVEVRFSPPLWVHMVLWLPLTLGGALGMLRPFKATLVALQYRNKVSRDFQ